MTGFQLQVGGLRCFLGEGVKTPEEECCNLPP